VGPTPSNDLAEFVNLQETFADSPKSWSVDASTMDKATFDLSVKNPNGGEEITHRSPQEIMDEITTLDAEGERRHLRLLWGASLCLLAQGWHQRWLPHALPSETDLDGAR